MNIFKKAFLSLTCMTALAASMPASAFTVTDKIESNPDSFVSFLTPYTAVHDITDGGFIAGASRLLSATLSVRLTDILFNENYRIFVGAGQVEDGSNVKNFTVDSATGGTLVPITLDDTSLADLNANGKISITVSARDLLSTFFFADSTLTAQVPEPMTLALLGAGLFGIGAARRKSAKSA
jgi:hypothetical protein